MIRALNRFFFSSTKIGGNLYSWGQHPQSLGYEQTKSANPLQPAIVANLPPNSVWKASFGPRHSAVLTVEGDLYTFGLGQNGVLGHNQGNQNEFLPKRIEFFSKNDLKVIDAKCGDNFTIALTDDGDVWTWGYGEVLVKSKFFFSSKYALGHKEMKNRFTPTPIKFFRDQEIFVTRISAGHNFATAFGIEGDLYNWGRGEYGVFGDCANKNYLEPVKNQMFLDFCAAEKKNVAKLKSANNYSMVLMDDGSLYGWGSNDFGQIGLRQEIGVEMFETANRPSKVADELFEGVKVKDFDIGENISIIQLEDGRVFWCGMRLKQQPTLLRLPATMGKIKSIGCCYNSLVVVDQENQLYMTQKYAKFLAEDDQTGIQFQTNDIFDKGDILRIGGKYRNKYAIVQAIPEQAQENANQSTQS